MGCRWWEAEDGIKISGYLQGIGHNTLNVLTLK